MILPPFRSVPVQRDPAPHDRVTLLPLERLRVALVACDAADRADAGSLRADSMVRLEPDTVDVTRARMEQAALDASAGRVARDGCRRPVSRSADRQLVCADCNAVTESWYHHEYAGLDAAGRGHVISGRFSASGATRWVNATRGQVLTLRSAPVFAPDGQHVAIANADLEAGNSDHILAIYRVTDSGAVEDTWRVAPEPPPPLSP